MKRWTLRLALLLVATLVFDQALNRLVLGDGWLLGRRIVPYDPPLSTALQWDLFERYRESIAAEEGDGRSRVPSVIDADLGWMPRTRRPDFLLDWAGSRIAVDPLARVKPAGVRRVVAIGCSFTYGAEVGPRETWAAIVDERREDLEVANLAVNGFGLDQALLRLRRDGIPLEPDEVWFGWMPYATLRVTTHFSPILESQARSVVFKPLFRLDAAGEPSLVPNPAPTTAALIATLSSQEAFQEAVGEHDFWVRRVPAAYAPAGSSWLHHSGLARLALTWLDDRRRHPWDWLDRPDSEVFRLYRALVLATARESERAGARFRVWVLPSGKGLRLSRDRFGGLYWGRFVEELQRMGVEVHDLSPVIERAGGLDNPELWMPEGHYSPLANRLVAEGMLAHLERNP